jgi:hypothetical protein
MARVCQEWYPETDGFYMNDLLKQQIDIMLKNIVHDWEFTIIISGQGEFRVGKSILEMQIMAYWTYQIEHLYGFKVPFSVKSNMVLNGSDLINKGTYLGRNFKYASLGYDEAADDLETSKVLSLQTKLIKDWMRKSAQYNMLTILVQSEFFEVPRPIAISRSTFLLDVYYTADERGIFRRGYFNFYSRHNKKMLYIKGKKFLDYNAFKWDFRGNFTNFYTLNEEEYRKAKRDSLTQWQKVSAVEFRRTEWMRGCIKYMYSTGLSHFEISEKINELSKCKISPRWVGMIIAGERIEDENDDFEAKISDLPKELSISKPLVISKDTETKIIDKNL